MRFILGIHHTKSLGSEDEDLEYAVYHFYRPLLTYLYANSDVKTALCLSGPVYEWIESNFPEINMLIKDLKKRKQLELLSGGYYNPAFPLISQKDRGQQIELMNTYIRKRFGSKPQGGWVADQLWVPSLVTTLNSTDLKYAVMFDPDEKDQKKRGGRHWYNPYVMSDIGKSAVILPLSHSISSMIPLKDPETVVREAERKLHETESEILSVMLDADTLISEFILADTSNLIGYIDKLIHQLNSAGFKLTLPAYILNRKWSGKGYLAAGWYNPHCIEDSTVDFHDHILRYPESQHAYNRLFYIERLISGVRKDKSRKKSAVTEMMKAQSVQFFWPDPSSGGIYHSRLRKEQYSHLIEADKITREKGVFSTSLNAYDMNADFRNEYIYRGKNITAVLESTGGSVCELDYLVNSWNYCDTFVGLPGDGIMTGNTHYRKLKKQNSFCDLFTFDGNASPENKYDSNTVLNLEAVTYVVEDYDKESKEIQFRRQVQTVLSEHTVDFFLKKRYIFKSNSIEVQYSIENNSSRKLNIYFISEMNISFGFEDIDFITLRSSGNSVLQKNEGDDQFPHLKYMLMSDKMNKTQLSLFSAKKFQVRTVHYSTEIKTQFGEEELYQHTIFWPFWHVIIAPNESWSNSFGIRIEKKKSVQRRQT